MLRQFNRIEFSEKKGRRMTKSNSLDWEFDRGRCHEKGDLVDNNTIDNVYYVTMLDSNSLDPRSREHGEGSEAIFARSRACLLDHGR